MTLLKIAESVADLIALLLRYNEEMTFIEARPSDE